MQNTDALILKLQKAPPSPGGIDVTRSLRMYLAFVPLYLVAIMIVCDAPAVELYNHFISLVIGLCAVVSLAQTAIASAVPGQGSWKAALLSLVTLAVWILAEALEQKEVIGNYSLEAGTQCLGSVLGYLILPAALLLFLVWRGAPLRSGTSAFFSILSAGVVANLGLRMLCESESALHIFLYHILPCAVTVTLGTIILSKFLSWDTRVAKFKATLSA